MTSDTKKHTRDRSGPAFPKGERVRLVRYPRIAEDGLRHSAHGPFNGPPAEVPIGAVGFVRERLHGNLIVEFPTAPQGVAFDQVHAMYCLEPVDE